MVEYDNPYINYSLRSLEANLNGLFKSSRNEEKLKKVIISYENLKIASLLYKKLIEFEGLSEEEKNKKELLFAVAGTNYKDKIKSCKEIEKIVLFSINSSIVVIAIYACDITHFKYFLDKYVFDYVHFAGHGTTTELVFDGHRIKSSTIENYFGSTNCFPKLFFINACFSYDLYNSFSKQISELYIVHSGKLDDKIATKYSKYYYEHFFMNKNIVNAYNYAQRKSCHNYYLVP